MAVTRDQRTEADTAAGPGAQPGAAHGKETMVSRAQDAKSRKKAGAPDAGEHEHEQEQEVAGAEGAQAGAEAADAKAGGEAGGGGGAGDGAASTVGAASATGAAEADTASAARSDTAGGGDTAGGDTAAALSSAASAASSASGPAGNDEGLVINRKAASEGTIEGAQAGAVMQQAQQSSTGAPLEAGVRSQMESGFGADFGDVRVHTGGAAADAAQGLNARAFAEGNDIYFGQGAYDPGSEGGKHLIAHELAHVAQGGGPAAKGTGGGASVSSPGDAHEVEADAAASTVVAGGTVGPMSNAAPGINRDALGDLDSTSKGNWLGNVDEAEALRRVAALSDAEKRRLATEEGQRPTIRRLTAAFDANEMVSFFTAVGHFDVRWKIYWLVTGGVVDELNQAQWRRVIATASPADMDSLRQYETGYRAFLQNGPDDLVPPWDRLQALKRGWWTGDAAKVRFALNSLSTAQRTTVRGDEALLRAILSHSGTGPEVFRAVTYLNLPLKDAVRWLNEMRKLPELTPQQWSQMLAEAPKAEFDALAADATLWPIAQQHCPPSVLQVVRQNTTDPNAVTTQLQDPVALGLLMTGLGPAGVLALATQPGTDVAVNYGHLKTAGKHLAVLNGLERGMRQGERTSANLKKWFDPATGETVISTLELMATVRFNMAVGGTGGVGQTVHSGATLAPWTAEGLRKSWQIMETLPPAMVESNPAFLHLLRNSANNGGYYAGTDTSSGWDNSAVVGLQGPTGAVMTSKAIYGGTMPQFNQTLRHEIGHAVDNQLTIMGAIQGEEWAGAWQNHGNATAWVDSMIAAGGGLGSHGYPAAEVGDYRAAMISAATNTTTFLSALNTIRAAKSTPLAPVASAPTTGPVTVLNNLSSWHHGSSFWNANLWQPQNGRNFVRGYGDQAHWWSFSNAKLTQKATDYQFRAPKEWFADAYAVYYAEQETGGDVPVGGLLRSKDQAAADFISTQIDKSYSPQLMVGGGVQQAPGTPGGVGG